MIGGKHVGAQDGKTFDVTGELCCSSQAPLHPPGAFLCPRAGAVVDEAHPAADPATGKVIGTVPDMTRADTQRAIQVAYDAFQTYRSTPAQAKADILYKLHALMVEHTDDIARLIVWENGKAWVDALAEAKYAASFFQWFAGEALRTHGQTIPCSLPGTRNFTVHQPVGVCALLVP